MTELKKSNLSEVPWEVFVIQHSHIDIGFTDRQEVIADYHCQFLDQAVTMALAPEQAARPTASRFRFTCEGFWAVEQFLASCNTSRKDDFVRALRQGDMELTAFYLHLTELLDHGHLRDSLAPACAFARAYHLPLRSAMMCDINGLSWGMADALVEAGVQYLISNLNVHHGGFPTGSPLNAFYWQAPSGGRILVWNGLPYHKANLLGLMGGWTPDENPGIPGVGYEGSGKYVDVADIEFAERTLPAVLSRLEADGYPYRFLPLMGSGLYTDNSPPTDRHCDLFTAWNARHEARIHVRSATLQEFFEHLEAHALDLPVYAGEWPDWWSDGVAAAPLDTLLFRNAQRSKRLAERLDPQGRVMTTARTEEIARSLMLYAEHTFGYSDTSSPALLGQQIFRRKTKLAVDADERASRALDEVLRLRGAGAFIARRGSVYRIINPLPEARSGMARLLLDWWEAEPFQHCVAVRDGERLLPCQMERDSRGWRVSVPLFLQGGEERDLHLESTPGDMSPAKHLLAERSYRNSFYSLAWSDAAGITSLREQESGQEVLEPSLGFGLAAPVYQRFPSGSRSGAGGFNMTPRTIPASQKFLGQCTGVRVAADGPVFTLLQVDYAVPGALSCSVLLRLVHGLPQIDLAVRVDKTHVSAPEGMYAAFPFAVEQGIWNLDKSGAAVRPGMDQIPGTCCDYYCVQDGAAYCGPRLGVVLTTLDAPLMHIGDLRLWQYSTTIEPHGPVYSWLTNNKWETNFPIHCGGNYEFRYVLEIGTGLAEADVALMRCRQNATPFVTLRAD